MTKVYNRKLKRIEEVKHFGGNKLNSIYKNKILTRILTSKLISKIYGLINSTKLSTRRIDKFIKDNNIDMSLYENKNYKSFNDFFIRKKKNIKYDKTNFISPVDGKLLVYKINKDSIVNIKNIKYTLRDLFNEEIEDLDNSYMFIYRLSLDNYHRFHYIDSGKRLKRVKIKGRLHTVSSSSNKYKIYKENEREYSILQTNNFGKIIYMEVGALLVGKIINYDLDTFKRGEEKGYFLPGGSTIIIIAKNIKVDSDILKYSKDGIETIVSVGEKVGEKKC